MKHTSWLALAALMLWSNDLHHKFVNARETLYTTIQETQIPRPYVLSKSVPKTRTTKIKRVIRGTVTTYQAVAGQTDASPCSGAMAGINFCKPPFPLVANNDLPLGTKVRINGVVYTVADRMNKRYTGKNYFDVLTKKDVYKKDNQIVEVL